MNTANKIELVKKWGFNEFTATSFTRSAPKGFTEWWSVERPDYIDFADSNGNFSHTYRIDWSIFAK